MKVSCGTGFNKIEVMLFAVKEDRRKMDGSLLFFSLQPEDRKECFHPKKGKKKKIK